MARESDDAEAEKPNPLRRSLVLGGGWRRGRGQGVRPDQDRHRTGHLERHGDAEAAGTPECRTGSSRTRFHADREGRRGDGCRSRHRSCHRGRDGHQWRRRRRSRYCGHRESGLGRRACDNRRAVRDRAPNQGVWTTQRCSHGGHPRHRGPAGRGGPGGSGLRQDRHRRRQRRHPTVDAAAGDAGQRLAGRHRQQPERHGEHRPCVRAQ